jgi:MoaA/NifB/PqqE/SkfB family radical SAM enzyme
MDSFLKNRLIHTNLQLLYDCNFKCNICDFWHQEYKELPRLSVAQIEVIAEKLNQVGPQIISIGGGEPLIHKDLVEIVRALARYHFPVMICNGWFVTPEIARTLFAAGMEEISISVDYASSDKHDKQRGMPGAFARAMRGLRILQENRRDPYQRVNMISVIMDDNLEEVEPLLRLCQEMGITYMVTLYSNMRGKKETRVIPKDISPHLLSLKAKYKHFVSLRGYIGKFSQAVREQGIGPCYAGKNLCNIDSNGSVSRCIDRLDEAVGNILTDDMQEIVRKLEVQQKRQDCRACWTSCRGSIETIRHGTQKLGNVFDYYQMTKPVALGKIFS